MQKEPIKVQIEEFEESVLPPSEIASPNPEDTSPEKKFALPKSSCSTLAVIIFLVVLLLVVVGVMFYFRSNGLGISADTKKDLTIKSEMIEQSGIVRIRVTEDEIQQGIDASGDKFPLKKTKTTIDEKGITISGRTGNNFLSLPVDVMVAPIIENGNLRFEITSIKSKNVEAPKVIKDKVNENLTTFLNGYIPQLSNIYLERVIFYKGFMELTGRKK